ncbi:unnamed protein product [Rhizophagus irregularis]|nr:unnamed protein product [Rhizophagus irregularis]
MNETRFSHSYFPQHFANRSEESKWQKSKENDILYMSLNALYFLWIFYVNLLIKKVILKRQSEYLSWNLVVLKRQFIKIELRKAFRPFMINLTHNKIKRFRPRASVYLSPAKLPEITRLNVKELKAVAKMRSENMMIF